MLNNTQNREKTSMGFQTTNSRNRKTSTMTAANGNGGTGGVGATISTPTHDEIAARASQIYLKKGRPSGRDIENWLEAETELMRERGTAKR